jgi:hypothetical protein
MMHGRHIGITPQLVCELVPALLAPDPYLSTRLGAWPAVFGRLVDEAIAAAEAQPMGNPLRPERRFGLLLSAHPAYSLLRLALPVVHEACCRLGRCYLFAADEIGALISEENYGAYQEELYQSLVQMATSDRGATASAPNQKESLWLFWQELALTLVSLSRPDGLSTPAPNGLPETDPLGLGFLLELKPELPPDEPETRALRRLPLPIKRQKSLRLREGGIDGIRVTRRLEDIDGILLSEFLNPPLLLADRLLNAGYMAMERQPKREKRRDVLIVALMPGAVQRQVSAGFVQACWFQALVRLSLVLREHQLHRSEFRWIEGDALGRVRSASFLLRDLPDVNVALATGLSSAYTREFLTDLRWLPIYLDTREPFHALATPGDARGGVSDTMFQWATASWQAQVENRAWIDPHGKNVAPSAPGDDRLQVEEFAFVHVMLFLPTETWDENQPSGTEALGRFYAGLRLGDTAGRSASLTWVPAAARSAAAWHIASRSRVDARVFPDAASAESGGSEQTPAALSGSRGEAKISGKLVQAWLVQWLKEMWRA